jgi:predicted DNA-binding protein
MASMVKVTFTLEEGTVERLRRTAARLGKPQSQIVREAIDEYAARAGKLSDEERQRLLAALDRAMSRPPSRPAEAVDSELREIRAGRRRWSRRPSRVSR